MPELTHSRAPGDIVDTPHGRGYLLHPLARTKRHEWLVMIGTRGHLVNVDEMAEPSTQLANMSKASTLEPVVTIAREIGTLSKDMKQIGTQLEMGI